MGAAALEPLCWLCGRAIAGGDGVGDGEGETSAVGESVAVEVSDGVESGPAVGDFGRAVGSTEAGAGRFVDCVR